MDQFLKYYRAKIRAQKNNPGTDINIHYTFIDKTPIEKVHLNFCKSILGTKRSSSNLAVRSELGRLPLESFISAQSIIYLARLYNENISPLLKEAFKLSQNLDETGIFSWFTYAKKSANIMGIDLSQLENCKSTQELKSLRNIIKKNTDDYFRTLTLNKIDNLDEENKIFLYKSIKSNDLTCEYYLSHPNMAVRKNITKFRISDHPLFIETGRYHRPKILRHERLCKICKVLDDEGHFFFTCKINESIRKNLILNFSNDYNTFIDKNTTTKLDVILNPSSSKQIKAVSSFIEQSLELRKEDSTRLNCA